MYLLEFETDRLRVWQIVRLRVLIVEIRNAFLVNGSAMETTTVAMHRMNRTVKVINQPMNKPINQSIDQSISQLANE